VFYKILLASLIFWITSCSGGEDPRANMAVPVLTERIHTTTYQDTIFATGTLAANEEIEIKSEIEGRVEEATINEGQKVTAGDLLFKIDEKKLSSTLAEAQANYNLAESTLKRNKTLFESKVISSQEYDQAVSGFESKKAELEIASEKFKDARIVAPFSGFIGSRQVSPGQFVNVGTILSTLVNSDQLKLEIYVPEKYLSVLKENLKVLLKSVAYPDEESAGTIFFVAPQIEPTSRTVLVKATVNNPTGKLIPGMFVEAKILSPEKQIITIPESALVINGEQSFVFVVDKDNIVSTKQVKIGVRLPGRIEINSGLKTGELIVTDGVTKLRPGGKVDITSLVTPTKKEFEK
jgi:membrane fusion protein (multidrug efflux system)